MLIWLVVWNIWIIFPYIGNVIIPFDFHIFQRGRSTTNQLIIMIVMTLDDIIMIVSSMTLLNKTPMTMSYSSLFSTYENMISEGYLLGLRVQRAQCVTPTHRQPLMKKPPGNCMQITQKNLPPSNSNHFW